MSKPWALRSRSVFRSSAVTLFGIVTKNFFPRCSVSATRNKARSRIPASQGDHHLRRYDRLPRSSFSCSLSDIRLDTPTSRSRFRNARGHLLPSNFAREPIDLEERPVACSSNSRRSSSAVQVCLCVGIQRSKVVREYAVTGRRFRCGCLSKRCELPNIQRRKTEPSSAQHHFSFQRGTAGPFVAYFKSEVFKNEQRDAERRSTPTVRPRVSQANRQAVER